MKEEIIYNKLVRDKIPEIIKNDGKECIIHKASDEEYRACLLDKVVEELEEFKERPSTEELADILEVIDSLIDYFDFDINEIKNIQERKRSKRGGFRDRIILEKVIEEKD